MNKLRGRELVLFESMKGKYISENERIFFETQRYKEENVITLSNDLVMFDEDNSDGIYIIRCLNEEYIVGHTNSVEEFHAMCLADALEANLRDLGYIDRNLTLLEWLRERDYEGVRYNHNFDEI